MTTPEDRARAEREQNRLPGWDAVLIGGFVLLAAGVLAWWAGLPDREPAAKLTTNAPGKAGSPALHYVGSKACGECHPGEYAHHSRSGHARTLRPAAARSLARRLDGRSVDDPEVPGVVWRYALRDGQLTAERSESGRAERFFLEYAFGSGRHATTFVSLLDRGSRHPRAFEHRLSVFAHSDAPGLTPGQSLRGHASGNTPGGRVHTADDTLKCFGCHTTTTSDRGPEELDVGAMIPNVSCERCHGPGRAHVEAARHGAESEQLALPLGPGRETAAEQIERCGACHRLPEMVRPGSIRTDNPVLVRHQTVGLVQSACYTRSQDALRCTTCHDPHARVSTDRPAYEATCLSCHRSPSQAVCPVSPRSGCLDCHMPRRDVARGMMMADHWIRVIPELDPRRDRSSPPAGNRPPPHPQGEPSSADGHGPPRPL